MNVKTLFNRIINELNKSNGPRIPKVVVRKLFNPAPRFISNVEMAACVDEWVRSFERPYDLIVGVPRSGLMVASLIATKLGKPLATTDNIVWSSKSISPRPVRNIIVIDDCITTGKSINAAAEKMKELYPEARVDKGVLFANERSKAQVDTFYRVLDGNQLFQWNLMHYKIGPVGFDLDGVLCEECYVDTDEEKYVDFLNRARPYLIPEYEIDCIITSRLEKYRPQTEKWLQDHDVKYKKLIMWDAPSKAARDDAGAFKSRAIKGLGIDYFIESSPVQAEKIWRTTKVMCLCMDEMRMFG